MKIEAPHIANLFNYGSYQGVKEVSLRSLLNVNELDVCNPQNTVSQSEFLRVYKTLVNKTNNSHFGLYYGFYLNIKALGFIAELSLNASSIEQAICFLQEYLNLTFPLVKLSVVENDFTIGLQLICEVENKEIKNHLLDTVLCFIYRELKLMLNNDFQPRLKLPYDDLIEYSNLLGAKTEKGEAHLIILDRKVLVSEINKKRVKEIELLLPKFMLMLDNNKCKYKGFSLQMRNMILNMCSPEIPTFERISKQFHLSHRTIQRKLTVEGQSFRKISDEVKRELSFYLAKGKQIKTQDIAYILGYSEPSAYLHAVKRWNKAVEI